MTHLPNTREGFLEFLRICEHRARCYVQGSAYHDRLKSVQPISGGWSVHFQKHPRVQEAEREGWGRDLRAACVAECKRRLMAGEDPGDPDDLMPKRTVWWEGVRRNAEQYRLAEEQRDRIHGGKHQVGAGAQRVLSDISRRMTGEADTSGGA